MQATANLLLQEQDGLARFNEPIRLGVPLPRGLLFDASNIELTDDSGRDIPVQGRPLAWWPNGSIKWLLLDCVVSMQPHAKAALTLKANVRANGKGNLPNQSALTLIERTDAFEIGTGSAHFAISRKGSFLPLTAVQCQGVDFLSRSGTRLQLLDRKGVEYTPTIERCTIEERGPLRATLLAEGRFVSSKGRPSPVNFKARRSFFAGLAAVRVELLVRNTRAARHPGGVWDLGDRGSFFVQDLSLNLDAHGEASKFAWYAESAETSLVSDADGWILYQDSSGGEQWNSRNHIDRAGKLTVSFPGYQVHGLGHGQQKRSVEGQRATPGVRLITSLGWIAATILDFWQNFPKALRAHDGLLSLGLLPKESRNGFELQGGEQKRHVVLLDFGLPGHTSVLPQWQHPIHAWIDPPWVEHTQAVSYFVSETGDRNQRYVEYTRNVIEGPHSFFNKREVIDEYGWRHFGDLYADHEAVNHQGPGALVSHYNNQYDFISGAFVHFMRTGDRRWAQLLNETACHTIDIDIYHTDDDKPAYNHGLFWHTDHYKDAATCTHRSYSRKNARGGGYGGGPSNEHLYTTGLLHYYYLTGDAEAAASVRELADYVIAMDDGSRTILGLFDEGPTGKASQTVSTLYHKPGRGAGNAINALTDAYRLSNDRAYFKKCEDLIQRCIHPRDNIEALNLDEPEYRWSYLVFLQVLGKYLDTKAELGEMDYGFFYARDSLLHYGQWMADNEVPYQEVLHKVEIPTETWPAQDIRKCHVFHLAAQYGPREKRGLFRERAGFFFERCLNDLLSYPTAFLTRPLVILTVYGYVHGYFQSLDQSPRGFASHSYRFGTPQEFLPQKARAKAVLVRKFRFLAAALKQLSRESYWRVRSHLPGGAG